MRKNVVLVPGDLSRGQLLTIPETADRLRVSSRTIYRMVNAGDLNTVKVRRCTRVKESSLARYLHELDLDEPDNRIQGQD
jgi:excisionase family DNA binding protein